MNELQSKLLEMMVDFDQFCRENHLTYYMIGGTMLGAYRHKGFIPWDDDMDIGMPRDDYERFLLLAKTKLKEPYVLRHQSVEPSVPYAFAHIENKNTNAALFSAFCEKQASALTKKINGMRVGGADTSAQEALLAQIEAEKTNIPKEE